MLRPLGVSEPATQWSVRRIVVIGPGIVGMPIAALLAHARICIGSSQPAPVVVIQRRSQSLGWAVDAINAGRSPVGGLEPALGGIIRSAVDEGLLSATHDYGVCRTADAILVCVQVDHRGDTPNEESLFDVLRAVAGELLLRAPGNAPLIVIESTLAPASLQSEVREVFREVGLEDGRDVYLGYCPTRVMPGRLVERVSSADRFVAGLNPETAERIALLYRHVVTRGTLHLTNALSAELAKSLETAYRDVRIALAAEVARYCDARDVDFYALREWLNGELLQRDLASFQSATVPRGGLLIPTLGVGGHSLPVDGNLLWWRAAQLGAAGENSVILEARRINDESPLLVCESVERELGGLEARTICLLGVAYRFNSDDARNSPTFALAEAMQKRGARVRMHDPHVRADDGNVRRAGLTELLTDDLDAALDGAELAVVCVAHRYYVENVSAILRAGRQLRIIVDAANAFGARAFADSGVRYAGIGRGMLPPPNEICQIVYDAYRVVERGIANEVAELVHLFNAHYAAHDSDRVRYAHVQQLVGTCPTGCAIADPGHVACALDHGDFASRLVAKATEAAAQVPPTPSRPATPAAA
jgi:nucleotide sugar dehydrogenase